MESKVAHATARLHPLRQKEHQVSRATISTPHYLLDQAKRRLTPTPNTLPGMGALDKRLSEGVGPVRLLHPARR